MCRRPGRRGRLRLGWAGKGGARGSQAEHRVHPGRRPRLGGRRLFWQQILRNAEHRPPGGRRRCGSPTLTPPAPVCSPTRASIMTGKYPARLHLTDWIPGEGRLARRTGCWFPNGGSSCRWKKLRIAKALKFVGYATAAHRQVAPRRPAVFSRAPGFDLNVAGSISASPPLTSGPTKDERHTRPRPQTGRPAGRIPHRPPDRRGGAVPGGKTRTGRSSSILPITRSTCRCRPSRRCWRSTGPSRRPAGRTTRSMPR